MHHLIFIPKAHLHGIDTAGQLAAVGLADHASGAMTLPIGAEGSPDGDGGTLFSWNPRRMHFNAAEQTWMKAVPDGDKPAGRYWVGVWNDAPPTEEELRKAILFGDDVQLGDGKRWHIAAPSFLPHDLILSEDGQGLLMAPKAEYQSICLEAMRWARRLMAPEMQTVPYLDLWRFAVRCLGMNYRLPPELVSHLRLIDEGNIKSIVNITCKLREE